MALLWMAPEHGRRIEVGASAAALHTAAEDVVQEYTAKTNYDNEDVDANWTQHCVAETMQGARRPGPKWVGKEKICAFVGSVPCTRNVQKFATKAWNGDMQIVSPTSSYKSRTYILLSTPPSSLFEVCAVCALIMLTVENVVNALHREDDCNFQNRGCARVWKWGPSEMIPPLLSPNGCCEFKWVS